MCLSWGNDAEDRPRGGHDSPRDMCRCDVLSIPEIAVSLTQGEGDHPPADVEGVAAGSDTVGECTPNGGKCDGVLDATCCNVCTEGVTDSGRYVCSGKWDASVRFHRLLRFPGSGTCSVFDCEN